MLHRTTILLPYPLKTQAVKAAAKRGVSFGELVRIALEMHLHENKKLTHDDTFFDDHSYYEGKTPTDIAKNHDAYLYKQKT